MTNGSCMRHLDDKFANMTPQFAFKPSPRSFNTDEIHLNFFAGGKKGPPEAASILADYAKSRREAHCSRT